MPPKADASIVCDVKDLALAETGKRRIEWAFQAMPVLQAVRKQFIRSQPLAGIRVAACLHVTAETANLMVTLRDGGAAICLCPSNVLSTQDDVAASLVKDYAIPVFAIKGETEAQHRAHLASALQCEPQVVMDNGCQLIPSASAGLCGTEETTSGVGRLRAMARAEKLGYPVVAVNEASTRHLFDNRAGTGQSALDGILRATNILIAGLHVVVAGYGWCGRGIATRARGLGANVIVTEVNPVKALEALMDGNRVMSMAEAAAIGDLFITATGNNNVIGRDHIEKFKNGAILCNAGHSNVELDLEALSRAASSHRPVREFVEEYVLRDGRRLNVLASGRLINLAAAEGHPAAVMDMSFANQALALEYMLKNRGSLEARVYSVPEDIDRQVARMKLESMGVKLDRLTIEQEKYLASWSEGA